jgi:hypothetical protein
MPVALTIILKSGVVVLLVSHMPACRVPTPVGAQVTVKSAVSPGAKGGAPEVEKLAKVGSVSGVSG